MNSKAGNLYIVATPIGNLGDITYRAVDTLKKVDRILVEDTRHARTLLDHYAIRTPLQAFHEHNELKLIPTIMEALQQGESYAMISDAGTPLISDPGYKLVNQLQIAGIQALTVPGACAAIAALCVSGMATNRFAFEGFLPAKTAARLAALEMLKQEPRTLIFYEGKHRIIACLQSMAQVFGAQREVVVGRELTKKFETVVAGAFDDVIRQIGSSPENQKGEFVILVEGLKLVAEDVDIEKILTVLLEELSVKQASKLAAKLSGVSKNICYEKAVQLQQDK
ncbi:MAG: 16S rRNA (cytidine1402-2'-O)-methyltransferase [Saprospiraceae bacterium]|jgi:16S rRNA (cytidine1402-2'-O)-methyltransferase